MVGTRENRLWRLGDADCVHCFPLEAENVVCKKDPEGIRKKPHGFCICQSVRFMECPV